MKLKIIHGLSLLNIQKNAMIKQLIKIPNLYDVKNNNLLELSTFGLVQV